MRVLRLRHRVPEEGADAEDIEPGLPQLLDGLDAGGLPLHGEKGREVAAVAGSEDDAVHPQEHDEDLDAGVAREECLGNPEVDAQDVHAGVGDRALAEGVAPAEGGAFEAFRMVFHASLKATSLSFNDITVLNDVHTCKIQETHKKINKRKEKLVSKMKI